MTDFSHITKDTKRAYEYFLNELCYTIDAYKLEEKIQYDLESFVLFDVREYEDYIDGHIPYAMHVPYHQIDEHLNMFSKDKVNILYGYSPFCNFAKRAAVKLTEKGYPVMEFKGGFKVWKKHGFDVIKDSSDMG